MGFVAGVCLCLFAWTFNMKYQLGLCYNQQLIMKAELKISSSTIFELKNSLVFSQSTITNLQNSVTTSNPISFPRTYISHHDIHTHHHNDFSDKNDFKNTTTKEETKKTSSETKTASKSQSQSTHYFQEKRCPSFVTKPAHNVTVQECMYLMSIVLSNSNTAVLNEVQICELKFFADKYIFWRCDNVTLNLTQSIYVYYNNHSVEKLQHFCLVMDDNNDSILTPDEMCIVKDFIYHL